MKPREGFNPEQVRNKSFALLNDLSKRQQEVYEIIKKFQPISNERIAQHLDVFPHQVTPRVLELRELGLVQWHGEGISSTSNRPVSLWKINPETSQLNLF